MLTRAEPPTSTPSRPRPPAPGQWRDAFGHMGAMRRQPVRSVTVVTVCYNASDSIRLTLESVKRQTFSNVEHVVIDGGSKDGTQDIVREYNVAYFVSEKDKGIYDAMEKGARAARGDILIFLNAGDLFYDTTVCAEVAAFFPEAGADFVFGDLMPAYLRPSDGHDHGAFRAGELLKLGYYSNRRRIYDESIHHQATFYRRWIFSKCSYYAEVPDSNGEYNVLMCAALRHNAKIRYIPRPISRFMLGGTSTANFQEEWARYVTLRDRLRGVFCPDQSKIPIESESEFHYQRPEPVKLRTKKWLKNALKASPPFKLYERLALGLSMRLAGALEHRFQVIEAASAKTAGDLQKNFSIVGRILDIATAEAGAANTKIAALEQRLATLEYDQSATREAVEKIAADVKGYRRDLAAEIKAQLSRDGKGIDAKLAPIKAALERFDAKLTPIESAISAIKVTSQRDAQGLVERLDAKLTPIEVALRRASEEIAAQVGGYGQDIVATIKATSERDAQGLAERFDAKLTPIEVALQRASEEITAQVGGYGQDIVATIKSTSERDAKGLVERFDAKLTPIEVALQRASEEITAQVGGYGQDIVATIKSTSERDAKGLVDRFDAKLAPVEVALQRASEEISAQVSGYGRDIVSAIKSTSERDAKGMADRFDAKLTPIEIALQRTSEEISAQVSGYGQDLARDLRERAAKSEQQLRDTSERVLIALSDASVKAKRGGDMADYGFRAFSQWDEDGLIQFLVSNLEIKNRVFAEVGVGDYTEANTRLLLLKDNWRGAIFDCGSEDIAKVKADSVYWRHTLEAVQAFVTAENVNELFAAAGLSGDIGLASIDIDGMDYWVWKALEQVSPQIVVIEYNGLLGNERAITVPYDAKFDRRVAHYSWLYAGSSLPALVHLGMQKGYEFVGSNDAGNNAFFVRKDIFAAKGLKPSRRQYVVPRFREGRNRDGSLAFLDDAGARKLIEDMPFVDVRTGASVRL